MESTNITHRPPHQVLDAARFPRARAHTQHLGIQAAFFKTYPNGIPEVYRMMNTPNHQGVCDKYVENSLPFGFYTNPSAGARAIFSTGNGERPFRKLDHILPARRIHLWSRDEIQAVCNSLRKSFWASMKNMPQPWCWESLWLYYDAHDIYHYGAQNLWNVTCHLYDENNIILQDLQKAIACEIGHWADDWLQHDDNKRRLKNWSETDGPIFFILNEEDHKQMGAIEDDAIPLVASALKCRRALLLADNFNKCRTEPNDVITTCTNRNFENWLAAEPILKHNGLPSPPASEMHRLSPTSAGQTLRTTVTRQGKHYFCPEAGANANHLKTQNRENSTRHCPAGQNSVLEALRNSAAAAGETTRRSPYPEKALPVNCIIANGSSKLTAQPDANARSFQKQPVDTSRGVDKSVQQLAPAEMAAGMQAYSPTVPKFVTKPADPYLAAKDTSPTPAPKKERNTEVKTVPDVSVKDARGSLPSTWPSMTIACST